MVGGGWDDMAARKRPRPRRGRGGQAKQETQRGLAALRAAQEGGLDTKELTPNWAADYVSFAHVVTVTGIGKGHVGDAIRRAGLQVYRTPLDARRRYIKKEDLERLTTFTPEPPRDAGDAGEDTGA
jgi:hypothetical protein